MTHKYMPKQQQHHSSVFSASATARYQNYLHRKVYKRFFHTYIPNHFLRGTSESASHFEHHKGVQIA